MQYILKCRIKQQNLRGLMTYTCELMNYVKIGKGNGVDY